MNPDEYHKGLEDLTAKFPVLIAHIVQTHGPLPDGEDDVHRALLILGLERLLNAYTTG